MSHSRKFRWLRVVHLVGIGGCIAVFCPVFSQETAVNIIPRTSYRGPTPSRPAIKVDVRVVLVPVTVVDSQDYPVTSLPRSSFKVYENDVEQDVLTFHKEDGPVSVGFIVDTSRSMARRMEPSIAAIEQFLKTGMPGDEYMLMRFSSNPSLITSFTERPEEIHGALSTLSAEGSTALNDAVYVGVQEMKRAKNGRKALFVLTDGADNNSRYSGSQVRSLVQESNVRVYAIGLFTRPNLLLKLANDSGGQAFWVRNMADLPPAVEKLSRELRNEYVLGYAPHESPTNGTYRRIRVELIATKQSPALHVSWRRGYHPPAF
jgi:Ca-activated chloride channel family protein